MRRTVCAVTLMWLVLGFAVAQDTETITKSFQRNFDRGTTEVKIRVLNDSVQYPNVDMGQLYLDAIQYVVANLTTLRADPNGAELALAAAKMIGKTHDPQSASSLWELFTADTDTSVRIALLSSLSQIAAANSDLITKINLWLATQNNLRESSAQVDTQVVAACVQTLGVLGDPSSFPVLFTASLEGYSTDITNAAAAALAAIKGSRKDLYSAVIQNNRMSDKLPAFKAAQGDSTMSAQDKAAVAMVSVQVALAATPRSATEQPLLNQLRFAAVQSLAGLKWAAATALLVQSFDRAVDEFSRSMIGEKELLDSINALGAMGTHEAAVRLSLYLDLLHTYREKGQPSDEQIVLAVIQNLSSLGDPVALDNLLYTQYLNYSDAVKKAAREAVNNLKAH